MLFVRAAWLIGAQNATILAMDNTIFLPQQTVLIEMLQDENAAVREAASDALAVIERSLGIAAVVKRLASGSLREQVEAVYSLRGVIAVDGQKLLMQLCGHPVPDIRMAALRVIEEVPHIRYAKVLLECLRDDHGTVAALAAKIIGEIGDKRAIPQLINAIREASDEAKAAILIALAKLQAVQVLNLAAKASRSPNPTIRKAAAEVLGMVAPAATSGEQSS